MKNSSLLPNPIVTYLSTPLPKSGGRSMQRLSPFSRSSAMLYMFLTCSSSSLSSRLTHHQNRAFSLLVDKKSLLR